MKELTIHNHNFYEGIHFNETRFKGYNARDIRFTSGGEVLYALVLDLPKEKTIVRSLAAKAGNGTVASVELVGSTKKAIWTLNDQGLIIQPAKSYPAENAVAYKIIFKK